MTQFSSHSAEPGRYDFGLSESQETRAAHLHRDSIVFDLASRFAGSNIFSHYPADLRADLQQRLALTRSKSEMVAEAIYWPFEMSRIGKSDLIREWLKAAGLTCGTYDPALHINPVEPGALSWDWDEKIRHCEQLPWLRFVTTAAEIRQAKHEDGFALYGNCQPIVAATRDLSQFDMAYRKGLRSFMLTYNRMDHIGVGCTERVDAGLSMFGVEVVKRLNDLRMIVDVSHCGHLTTMDACRVSSRPVTANHTAARSLCDHARGKTDEALRAIADTGGVIGVLAVPAFLSTAPQPTIDHMLDHIDFIAALVGWEHVAIGTDWPWPVPESVLISAVGIEPGQQMGFRPQDRVDRRKRLFGFEDCRDLPNITRGLIKRGYSDLEIRGILGENAMRVFESVCG